MCLCVVKKLLTRSLIIAQLWLHEGHGYFSLIEKSVMCV